MAIVYLNLSNTFIFYLHAHIPGGAMLLSINISATVLPFMSVIFGSCYHYYGGFIPAYAKYIATV